MRDRTFKGVCGLGLMLAGAGSAFGAGHEYVGGDIFADRFMRWNSADIAGTQEPGPAVPGPFTLGIEFVSGYTGWAVLPYNETVAQAPFPGVYRIDDGVPTKIAPMPFKTPAFAGLERSQDGSIMYTLLDRNWLAASSSIELYSIDFSGTFAKLATLAIPGVTKPDIDGLARNPLSGDLYFINREAHVGVLYKVNPSTFAVTRLGSMGVFATGATNLAFSEDGSELICLTNLYKLYSLDPLTGHPTLIGDSPAPFGDFEAVHIPAPGVGMLLAASGLAGLAGRRRRGS